MQIEMRKISELKPYVNNPRKNEKAVDAISESIKKFGFNVPLTIDSFGVVVTGHARLKAAIKLGFEEVPVIVLNKLSCDEIKAFRIVDNKVAEIAEWDFKALAIELEEINIDLSAFNFELPDSKTAEEDDYNIKLPKEPKSKVGDIYQLERHRLMCADATISENLEKLMDGKTADLVVIDPPYNVDYQGTAGKIMNDKMPEAQFFGFLKDLFTAIDKHLKPGGAFYIWHADNQGNSFREACKLIGWTVRQCLIWNKNAFVIGRQDYQWKHEPCLYGWKDGAAHYFINDRTFTTIIEQNIDIDKLKASEARELLKQILGADVPITIIDEDRPQRNAEHPTMKPVRLIGRLISNSSKPGQIVLDTVAGSGTTMVAAEQLNRTAYLMELDPRYVDVIIDRYEKLTGNKAELINRTEREDNAREETNTG